MSAQPKSRLPSLLLCAALLTTLGGLSVVGWAQWSVPLDTSPRQSDRSASPFEVASLKGTTERFVAKPLSVFRETVMRPLFSETRRPIPKKTVRTATPKPKPVPTHIPIAQLQLTGVAVRGDERRALVKSPSAPNGAWHTTGDIVGGWKIIEIAGNFARLSVGEKAGKLQLYVDKSGITSD